MSLEAGELVRKMQSVLFSLLPSVLVLLLSTVLLLPLKNEVLAVPLTIPRPPPGSKVVIVVGGGAKDGMVPSQTMMTGESQINERKSMILLPTAATSASNEQQINRQGILSKTFIPEMNKNDKSSRFAKLLAPASRHISGGIQEMFNNHKPFQGGKLLENEKQAGLGGIGQQLMDFRPHQPDITPDLQNNNGKLSLPVIGYSDENNGLGAGLGVPSPTPMANKLNPYTNGVASSFPPGIDPYEGFIRYAAENLDTPMGNIVDYHSLEHYYGPQHPLSPYHTNNKETANLPTVPSYADNFSYNNNNALETSNSPPPRPPPPGPGPGASDEYGDGPGPDDGPPHGSGGGFRSHNHPMGGRPGGPRDSNHNSVRPASSYEHGIDHFDAPSPGSGSSPPRPIRPPMSDPALYGEEEHGPRHGPPYDEPPPDMPPYRQSPHAAPYKHSPSLANGPPNSLSHIHDDDSGPPPPPHGHSPEPPDLDVFEEGPPPPGSQPPVPPPPHARQNSPSAHPQQPENNDGGDDAIWGILDLAEMLEKGQVPGQSNTALSGNSQASPQTGVGATSRVVVPIFTRPPPPKFHASSGGSSSPGGDHASDLSASPPHIPPPPPIMMQANNQKPNYSEEGQGADADGGGFDYDDNENPEGEGGNQPRQPYGGQDSQEAHDYGDDGYSK